MADIRVTNFLSIPESEVLLRTSRSSGPGGQHANVTASRVEAVFDVAESAVLSDSQKQRVINKLGPVVRAVSQDARSQHRNRELALQRLSERLAAALYVPRPRTKTKPSKGAVRRRLEGKSKRSEIKQGRKRPKFD